MSAFARLEKSKQFLFIKRFALSQEVIVHSTGALNTDEIDWRVWRLHALDNHGSASDDFFPIARGLHADQRMRFFVVRWIEEVSEVSALDGLFLFEEANKSVDQLPRIVGGLAEHHLLGSLTL